jgi:hypothetical protein
MLPLGLLWKYLGVDNHQQPRLSFLGDCFFRITQPTALNDPYEGKLGILLDQYSADDRKVAREIALSSGMFPIEISDENVEMLLLDSFPHHRLGQVCPSLFPSRLPHLRDEPFSSIEEIDKFRTRQVQGEVGRMVNETWGVLSLSEDPANCQMWSHYGASHHGTAVGFDQNHPFFTQVGKLSKMEYLDQRISVSSNGGVIRIGGHKLDGQHPPHDILLRKGPGWEYEKEWRLIVTLDRADESRLAETDTVSTFLLKIPKSAISAIILGAKTNAEHVRTIREKMNAALWQNTQLFHARLSQDDFTLEFDEISVG